MKNVFIRVCLVCQTLLLIGSCQTNEPTPTIIANSYQVSLQQAKLAAQKAYTLDMVKGVSKAEAKLIQDVLPVPDTKNPSYYILNYKNGGYVIIAGDLRVEPVLAYSETGAFPKSGTIHYGLLDWLRDNHEGFQLLKKDTSYKAPKYITKMWDQVLVNNATAYKMPPAQPCQDRSFSSTKGPLLLTQWGQGCKYNMLCPKGTNEALCFRSPTGCVATSMSQIMRYYQKPIRYNWTSMPLNTGNYDVSKLMYDAGLSVNMKYGDNASGTQSEEIPGAFITKFGYKSATYEDYNYEKVEANLTFAHPVILTAYSVAEKEKFLWWTIEVIFADGHAWITDGYEYYEYSSCECGCGGSVKWLHMNWGWNDYEGQSTASNCNGWYRENDWKIVQKSSLNFQYNKHMIHNIIPL